MSKITKDQAQIIINEYVNGVSSYELADRYKLWQTSICNTIRGQCWKSCKRPSNIFEIIKLRDANKGHRHKKLPELNEEQKNIIVGSLLGDGSIKKPHFVHNGNSAFAKTQRLDRKPYLDWHFEKMGEYSAKIAPVFSKEKLSKLDGKIIRTASPKRLSAYAFSTFVHPNITKFRDVWYLNGIKQVPNNLKLNPQSIAIWYCDDGSNCYEHRLAVICTQGFTINEAEILVEKFKPQFLKK